MNTLAEATPKLNVWQYLGANPHIKLTLIIVLGSFILGWDYALGGLLEKPLQSIGINFYALSLKQWIELSIAGLTMGLLFFLMASGMTLVFGLMSILNLAHGAFILLGAVVGYALLQGVPSMPEIGIFKDMFQSNSYMQLFFAILFTCILVGILSAIFGLAFERYIIRPVYTDHLKQILVTVGGGIIITELMVAYFTHGEDFAYGKPEILTGSARLLDGILGNGIVIDKYRLVCALIGLSVYFAMNAVLNKTKIGLLIRAGVQSKEMVEVMGYRIKLLFIGVFVAAGVLASLGGVFWSISDAVVTKHSGEDVMIVVIVSIIIGGMGSVKGCVFATVLCGLTYNYISGILPGLAPIAYVLLLLCVLMWKPQGLIPVLKF